MNTVTEMKEANQKQQSVKIKISQQKLAKLKHTETMMIKREYPISNNGTIMQSDIHTIRKSQKITWDRKSTNI